MSPNQVRSAEDPQPTLMKETKVLIHMSFISYPLIHAHVYSYLLIQDFLAQKQGAKISIADVEQLVLKIREARSGFNSSNLFSLRGDDKVVTF